jgi:hypothetical protein
MTNRTLRIAEPDEPPAPRVDNDSAMIITQAVDTSRRPPRPADTANTNDQLDGNHPHNADERIDRNLGSRWHPGRVRELSEVERATLSSLLSIEFDGVDDLRRQVEHIRGAEPNCTCGCPSITPDIDRRAAPPSSSPSPLPVELAEMKRDDGVARTVLCFLDAEGYIANLECVYYDDAQPAWPDPAECSVLIRDSDRYLEAVALPRGVLVRPHEPEDRWVSFEPREGGGFCATTFTCYRECFGADGLELTRVFVK